MFIQKQMKVNLQQSVGLSYLKVFWSNRYRCCYMDLVVSSLSFFLFLNLLTLSWWIWRIQNYFLFEPISFASLTENISTIFVAVLTLQLLQISCWKAPRGIQCIRRALAKWSAQPHKHISYFKAFSLQSSHKPSDESQKEAEKKTQFDMCCTTCEERNIQSTTPCKNPPWVRCGHI